LEVEAEKIWQRSFFRKKFLTTLIKLKLIGILADKHSRLVDGVTLLRRRHFIKTHIGGRANEKYEEGH
jgi:hypothetical protein